MIARIVVAGEKKKAERSFIAPISWLHSEIDSGSFCAQNLYNVAMINVLRYRFGKNKHIAYERAFVFEVIIRFHDQQRTAAT